MHNIIILILPVLFVGICVIKFILYLAKIKIIKTEKNQSKSYWIEKSK